MISQHRQQGYLLVDHRASPGLPDDVARLSGYDPRFCKEGKFYEADTLTCSHCKIVQIKNLLRTRDRAFCAKCMHYICDACHIEMQGPMYSHLPFEKLKDAALEFAALGISFGTPQALREAATQTVSVPLILP